MGQGKSKPKKDKPKLSDEDLVATGFGTKPKKKDGDDKKGDKGKSKGRS
jgi:hypothetical protein